MRPFYPAPKIMGRLVRPRHRLPSRLAREFIETLNEVIAAQDSVRGAYGRKRATARKKKS
jgi:hypothetical protein